MKIIDLFTSFYVLNVHDVIEKYHSETHSYLDMAFNVKQEIDFLGLTAESLNLLFSNNQNSIFETFVKYKCIDINPFITNIIHEIDNIPKVHRIIQFLLQYITIDISRKSMNDIIAYFVNQIQQCFFSSNRKLQENAFTDQRVDVIRKEAKNVYQTQIEALILFILSTFYVGPNTSTDIENRNSSERLYIINLNIKDLLKDFVQHENDPCFILDNNQHLTQIENDIVCDVKNSILSFLKISNFTKYIQEKITTQTFSGSPEDIQNIIYNAFHLHNVIISEKTKGCALVITNNNCDYSIEENWNDLNQYLLGNRVIVHTIYKIIDKLYKLPSLTDYLGLFGLLYARESVKAYKNLMKEIIFQYKQQQKHNQHGNLFEYIQNINLMILPKNSNQVRIESNSEFLNMILNSNKSYSFWISYFPPSKKVQSDLQNQDNDLYIYANPFDFDLMILILKVNNFQRCDDVTSNDFRKYQFKRE